MNERKRRRKRDGIHGTTRHLPHLTLLWPAPTQKAFTVPTLLQKMLVAALFEAASSLAGKEMVTSRLTNAAASRTPAPTASPVNRHARRPLLRVPASLLLLQVRGHGGNSHHDHTTPFAVCVRKSRLRCVLCRELRACVRSGDSGQWCVV
jgi:hypothetical protein